MRFEGSDAPFIAFWSKNTNEWLLAGDVDPVYDGIGVIVLTTALQPPKC